MLNVVLSGIFPTRTMCVNSSIAFCHYREDVRMVYTGPMCSTRCATGTHDRQRTGTGVVAGCSMRYPRRPLRGSARWQVAGYVRTVVAPELIISAVVDLELSTRMTRLRASPPRSSHLTNLTT